MSYYRVSDLVAQELQSAVQHDTLIRQGSVSVLQVGLGVLGTAADASSRLEGGKTQSLGRRNLFCECVVRRQ